MTTEPTTLTPPALPAPDLPTTPSTGYVFSRLCAHSVPQWETPTFEEIVRFEYHPSPAQHPHAYLYALHVIYFVRDVKVKQLEEALRRHTEQHALSYELWPSITLLPIYEKAIKELFETAEYEAAQLRKRCDPNTEEPSVPRLKDEKKNQLAPELTCESLQRQWGVTIVRSAVSGIKDARVAVLYDNEHSTIEKQHNRQPLRKLKGRKHNAD